MLLSIQPQVLVKFVPKEPASMKTKTLVNAHHRKLWSKENVLAPKKHLFWTGIVHVYRACGPNFSTKPVKFVMRAPLETNTHWNQINVSQWSVRKDSSLTAWSKSACAQMSRRSTSCWTARVRFVPRDSTYKIVRVKSAQWIGSTTTKYKNAYATRRRTSFGTWKHAWSVSTQNIGISGTWNAKIARLSKSITSTQGDVNIVLLTTLITTASTAASVLTTRYTTTKLTPANSAEMEWFMTHKIWFVCAHRKGLLKGSPDAYLVISLTTLTKPLSLVSYVPATRFMI